MTQLELQHLSGRLDAVESTVDSMVKAQKRLFAKIDSLEEAGSRREVILSQLAAGQTSIIGMLAITQEKDAKQDRSIEEVRKIAKAELDSHTPSMTAKAKEEGAKWGTAAFLIGSAIMELFRHMGYF